MPKPQERRRSSIVETMKEKEAQSLFVNYFILLVLLGLLWIVYFGLWWFFCILFIDAHLHHPHPNHLLLNLFHWIILDHDRKRSSCSKLRLNAGTTSYFHLYEKIKLNRIDSRIRNCSRMNFFFFLRLISIINVIIEWASQIRNHSFFFPRIISLWSMLFPLLPT